MPICFRLLLHFARAAASRTFCTAGSRRPIRMAMMAMTTNSSMSVNPRRGRERTDMAAPRGERMRATGERGHYPVQGVRLILVMGDYD
jgi:hypothetical protein